MKRFGLIILVLSILAELAAQESAIYTDRTLHSSILDMEVHYSIYLPPSYFSNETNYYPVLYLLHGLFGNHLDWPNNGVQDTVDNAIASGNITEMIIAMPDGMDAFYCNNYDVRDLLYEDFMAEEFIPFIETEYRVISEKGTRAIAGLSMGGYGTTLHAFKYHDKYSSAYSMSGAVLLGGNEPDLQDIVDAKIQEELDNFPAYTMEIGEQDFLYFNNEEFHNYLDIKDIEHTFITREGTHEWKFWRECLPKALTFASNNFESQDINSEQVAGVKEHLRIYPNPADNYITVMASTGQRASLYTLTGIMIRQKTILNRKVTFELSDLNSGIYLLVIDGSQANVIVKVIVR